MERLTFVDEKGRVLFTPKGCYVGCTITQLAEDGHTDLLEEIAQRLANHEQRLKYYDDLEAQCAKENSCGIQMMLKKWSEFLEDIQELERYRNLEQQGKLLKPPCTVGDTVYVIPSSTNFGLNIVNGHEENNRVYEQIVDHVEMRRSGYLLSTCDGMACVIEDLYKETWFTDKKEAKVKLKELERHWQNCFSHPKRSQEGTGRLTIPNF